MNFSAKSMLGVVAIAASLVAGSTAAQASTIYPKNDGFELPDLGTGFAYGTDPSLAGNAAITGWVFSVGNVGIAANGSGFNLAGATNQNQNGGATSLKGQAAFLQANGVSFSQAFFLPTSPFAILSFDFEGRQQFGAGGNAVTIFFDGAQIGGPLTPVGVGSFTTQTVSLGSIVGGVHTLTFVGNTPGDYTTFIDNVSVTVPDGGMTVTLLGLGLTGLAYFRRKRD